MVQLFVTHKSSSYETELAEPPKRQHGEKSEEPLRLKRGVRWRIEQKELQKQRSARLRSSLQTRYKSE